MAVAAVSLVTLPAPVQVSSLQPAVYWAMLQLPELD